MDIGFLEADAETNPFSVKVFDSRPFADRMMSTTSDPAIAAQFSQMCQSTGQEFRATAAELTEDPEQAIALEKPIQLPVENAVGLEGIVYKPDEMENKWAIFAYNNQFMFVRSWTHDVSIVAPFSLCAETNQLSISTVYDAFKGQSETSDVALDVDFLLRTHCLNQDVPLPLSDDVLAADSRNIATIAFSMAGRHARFACSFDNYRAIVANDNVPMRNKAVSAVSKLHLACVRGEMDNIDKFVQEKGKDVWNLMYQGQSPLHFAFWNSDKSQVLAVIQKCLDLGADPNQLTSEHSSPLTIACESGNGDAVALLLKAGSDPTLATERGFTPLHMASERGNVAVVKQLLEASPKPDVNAVATANGKTYTPMQLAELQKQDEVIALLKEHQ